MILILSGIFVTILMLGQMISVYFSGNMVDDFNVFQVKSEVNDYELLLKVRIKMKENLIS